MVEGLKVYREMLDNIKYLNTFVKLYPIHRDYVKSSHKYQPTARPHYAKTLDYVEILDKDLNVILEDCKNFAKFLKSENLNSVLDLELDLEWEYLELNQRFIKIFDVFAHFTEEVAYLKKADERRKLAKK